MSSFTPISVSCLFVNTTAVSSAYAESLNSFLSPCVLKLRPVGLLKNLEDLKMQGLVLVDFFQDSMMAVI